MNALYKTLIYDKQVSLSVLETTELVNDAIKIHCLQAGAAKTLGELLTCGAYMSGCLKSELGAISITIKGADGSGSVSVSGDVNLHMRGYIDGSAEGRLKGGYMTVVKDDGFYRPFTGACELISDDVSENMENYFRISEQIPTYVKVNAVFGEDGKCVAAGGAVMQLLPGTSEKSAAAAREKMESLKDFASVIAEGGAKGLLDKFFAEETKDAHIYLTSPQYKCNCSREKISSLLVAMGKDELESILKEQGEVSVHCHYCNTDYKFDGKDIEELLK